MAVAMLASGYGCFFFLSFGASRIASQSENYAARKRLCALGFVLVLLSLCFFEDAQLIALVISTIVLAFATVDAVTEPLPLMESLTSKRKSTPLAAVGRLFLTPGWISGLFFSVISVGLWLGGVALFNALTKGDIDIDRQFWIASTAMYNLILFPLIFIHLFFRTRVNREFTFGWYSFIQLGLLVVTFMAMAMSNAVDSERVFSVVPIPSVILFASMEHRIDEKFFLYFGLATTALCFFVPLIRNRREVGEFFSWVFRPR